MDLLDLDCDSSLGFPSAGIACMPTFWWIFFRRETCVLLNDGTIGGIRC